MAPFISANPSVCTGCRTCEMVCSLYHWGECHPDRAAIRVIRREKDGLVFCLPLVCQQCEPAYCMEACPSEALGRKEDSAPLSVDEEKCTGCGNCAQACPAGSIFMDEERNLAVCCDLCGGRPQCVSLCHAHALTLGKSDQARSRERIARVAATLKAEGLRGMLPGKRAR